MKTWVQLAGLGQLALALASLALPRVLGWKAELARLAPLTRQVFWTYAAYIWSFNVAFGILSAGFAELLLDGQPLSRAVAGAIAAYWGGRLLVQIAWFGKQAPRGLRFRLAEAALLVLFAFLTIVYSIVAL